MPDGHQVLKEITWLAQSGITNGWSDGTFRPKEEVSREAFATFLYRDAGRPAVNLPSKSPFKDLTPNSKFYKEITWLDTKGITNGWSDGTYWPYNSVTREATAAFFYRLNGRPAVDIPPSIPKSFTMKGAGFGHGVGMSQYGAQGMAVDGYDAGEILRHYYTGTQVSTVDADRNISVEIFGSGNDNRNAVDVVVTGDWRMRFYDYTKSGTGILREVWVGSAGERLKVTREGTTVVVERPNGDTATANKDISLHWENTRYYEPGSSKNATVDFYRHDAGIKASNRVTHGTYRHGRIFISVPNPSSPRLIIANELKLNTEYLYGIAEVPSSWHLNTRQAQAIVARGYAMRAMSSKSATCNCHIYDDIRDQNFTGWRKENEQSNGTHWGNRWVDAVNRTTSSNGTRGKVLTKGGSIVVTHYFSSSGGRTENSEDIWTSTLSHERAVDDRWSLESRNPNREWTRTITQSQARSVFGLSDVVHIQVTERTSSNSKSAAKKVTATSSTGQKATITGPEPIRSNVVGGHSPWIWSFTPNF